VFEYDIILKLNIGTFHLYLLAVPLTADYKERIFCRRTSKSVSVSLFMTQSPTHPSDDVMATPVDCDLTKISFGGGAD
jgi:hypothetical protein